MTDINIITGKINVNIPGSQAENGKKMYVKIFPGTFTMKAPKPKKAKVLVGELIVRYSGREWPEKKFGTLVGEPTFLSGVTELLTTLNLINTTQVSWAIEQTDLKESVSITLGTDLAQEIIDRGWANII